MQSDIAKSDVMKSELRIGWPKSSDFGPQSDDSAYRIPPPKMAPVFNQVEVFLSRSLTRVTKSYLLALRTTQIRSHSPSTELGF